MTGCVLSATHKQMFSLCVFLSSLPHHLKMLKRRSVFELFIFAGLDKTFIFTQVIIIAFKYGQGFFIA